MGEASVCDHVWLLRLKTIFVAVQMPQYSDLCTQPDLRGEKDCSQYNCSEKRRSSGIAAMRRSAAAIASCDSQESGRSRGNAAMRQACEATGDRAKQRTHVERSSGQAQAQIFHKLRFACEIL